MFPIFFIGIYGINDTVPICDPDMERLFFLYKINHHHFYADLSTSDVPWALMASSNFWCTSAVNVVTSGAFKSLG